MPNSVNESSECILDDPELDIVPENHHYVNQCICHLCSCGKHICPSIKQIPYPKSTFSTYYKSAYNLKSTPSPPKKIVPLELRPTTRCIDWQTTNRKDYTNPGIVRTDSVNQLHTVSPVKFVSSSVYKSEYPNWGSSSTSKIRAPVLSHALTDIKLSCKTTYNDKFQRTVTPPPKTSSIARSCSLQRILGLQSAHYEITTTNRSEYRWHTLKEETRLENRRHSHVPLKSSPLHYLTSSRSQYTPQKVKKNPILLKKQSTARYL